MRLYQDFDTPVMLWLTACYKAVKFCEVFNLNVKFYFVNFVGSFQMDEGLRRRCVLAPVLMVNRRVVGAKPFPFCMDYR